MTKDRAMFSVCIPAYNRAAHLESLLDSVLAQQYDDYEIVICEDLSRERPLISSVVQRYIQKSCGRIRYFENEENLGYDANIRRLVEKADGEYCFFMGNDDLMCPNALSTAADAITRHDNVGFVLRAYGWFDEDSGQLAGEVNYFNEERVFAPGAEAISVCFRRSGVISGYIVHRDSAHESATDLFDGGLYYQMHLTANVLATRCAVYIPTLLVLCRNSEPPEFGNSAREKGRFIPGRYTPDARLRMVGGALAIIRHLRASRQD